jgi:AcrR family transcriptional regulator
VDEATVLQHRPMGRERLLLATEACLRAGHDVRIADVCRQADVSPALIYKYFIDRDDLVAEAYARIYNGLVARYLFEIAHFPTDLEALRIAVRAQAEEIFSADRDDVRWSRLEALSHARTNPGVAARIESVRRELVQRLADVLMNFEGVVMSPGEAEAFSVICLGMVLGVTAMSPQHMSDEYRANLADAWSTMVYATLTAART